MFENQRALSEQLQCRLCGCYISYVLGPLGSPTLPDKVHMRDGTARTK